MLVTWDKKGCLFAANYLKGAVHQGLVQVDDDTVPAVVCYTDLWQQELGWWLSRQREQRTTTEEKKKNTG